MKIFLISPYPTSQGPMYGISLLMKDGLERQGCIVYQDYWGQHIPNEIFIKKIIQRPFDVYPIIRRIKSCNCDVVIINSSHSWNAVFRDIPLILLLRKMDFPYVLLYHGTLGTKLNDTSPLYRLIFGWSITNALGVFCLSSEEQKTINKIWPSCLTATVRLPFFHSNESSLARNVEKSSIPIILFVGRLIYEKGVLDLIDAVTILFKQIDCRLVIVGGGPILNKAINIVQRYGIQDKVTFKGRLEHEAVLKEMEKANIFVLPTYNEGFPVVILEAMSKGLPIITTRVGGMADWLVNKENVIFIPIKNKELLAESIIYLLKDPVLRKTMVSNNLRRIIEFSPSSVMKDYLKYIYHWKTISIPGFNSEVQQ